MNKKLRTAFIIVSVIMIGLLTLLLTSSIGGKSLADDYKYLIDNGVEVDGKVVNYRKSYYQGTNVGWYYYGFTLFYEYEENGQVWKTSERWTIREELNMANVDEINEMDKWCKESIGKSIKLIVDNKGHCLVADKAQSIYKNQFNFVYVRGGILLAGDIAFVIVLLFCIFYKRKNKDISLPL